jgi:hypothetical protein
MVVLHQVGGQDEKPDFWEVGGGRGIEHLLPLLRNERRGGHQQTRTGTVHPLAGLGCGSRFGQRTLGKGKGLGL